MNTFLRRVLAPLATTATLACAAVILPATARAADTPYCTATLPSGSTATAVVAPHCFSTFGDSIAYASGGKVHLADAQTARAVTPDELNPPAAASSTAAAASPNTIVVISIDYQNANFGGASFTWTAGAGCGSYAAASMPSGWNDIVSSVATYNGCGVTLYQNGSYGGTHYNVGVNSSAANLGSFNDQASSERWCTAPTC